MDDRARMKVIAVGIRKQIQGIFTIHTASKKCEGWKQKEPGMEASKDRQKLKENLDKVRTLKPKVETVS